ncbi:response regulator transcription factor [Cytobacillus spongiae]|jgi:DNA-binding response OmpR family regulator|uniref:response regulator transcription factor n=1 Tax=Cytobacillus spongiae TaxID=2901381 RepID=UPI001F365468|nr:response regulator transcription factor [Cytobacillus spongiae]UII54851.1 response regulator transcription factor [Cytobacillus spongiae]
MINILAVDDDQHILTFIEIHLLKEGYEIFSAKDGIQALSILQNVTCDLAIIDVMMPYMDGYELTKKIRKEYDIPIILLTAKDQMEDKEQGFLAGTDDYLVKPFEPKELSFRINALLRRYVKHSAEAIIQIGNIIINKNSYEVQAGNRTIFLPLKEFELLYFLMSNGHQVFSRAHLIEQIWGIDFDGDERTVDVHIKRLRERFSGVTNDFQIKTVRGVGYSLEGNKG